MSNTFNKHLANRKVGSTKRLLFLKGGGGGGGGVVHDYSYLKVTDKDRIGVGSYSNQNQQKDKSKISSSPNKICKHINTSEKTRHHTEKLKLGELKVDCHRNM